MKKNNKIPKTKVVDPARETRVLLEDIRQQVQTVAEGHGAIIRKLDEHDGRFDAHDGRFDKIDLKLIEHDEKFAKIDSKLVEHDKKFARVESELQSISMAVMDIGNITKDHEKRVKKLEEKTLV